MAHSGDRFGEHEKLRGRQVYCEISARQISSVITPTEYLLALRPEAPPDLAIFRQDGSCTRRKVPIWCRFPPHESPAVMVEEFSFLMKDFEIEHQGEPNNLNITIQYRYRVNISDSEYPDFRLVANDIKTFLADYLNEKDHWEVVNKKITLMVLDKYPSLAKGHLSDRGVSSALCSLYTFKYRNGV